MAKVLSSISGNLISAASAGFAPTNSADVSAIASAYQVVSATGTQLYGGTAHVTSVNSAPLSASRAGNAANASMANSAYYDGTGRLISSLPDSAAVSAIASAYATAKVDKSSISAQSSNWNSVYNTVSSNSASWSGSTGGSVTSPSGTIFVKDGNKVEGTNSAVLTASGGEGFSTELYPAQNYINQYWGYIAIVSLPESGGTLTIRSNNLNGRTVIFSGMSVDGLSTESASASATTGATSLVVDLGGIARNISASSNGWMDIQGNMTAEKAGGVQVTGVAELAWKSAVDNVTTTVATNSAHWGQGGVDSATVSAIASAYQVVSSTASGSGEIFGQTAYYATEINGLTLSAQEAALATYATNAGSAGAAPTNSSDVSAIASGYASGKADSSALSSYALSADVSGTIDTVSSNSATWGAGGIDSATCSAIASSYANDVSAAVSGTVDTVSTQSANWGGSALALSAGPGVSLTKSGNTLIAGLDETVLWSGATTSITAITLNESYANFDRVRFYWNPWTDTLAWQVTDIPSIVSYINLSCGWANNSQRAFFVYEFSSTDKLTFSQVNGAFTNITGTAWTTATGCKVYKVVGINRTAGV